MTPTPEPASLKAGDEPARPARPFYPTCSGCGHNTSGVVAEVCTSFVPYPEGDPRGHAGYCGHRCVDDPAVKAWLEGR